MFKYIKEAFTLKPNILALVGGIAAAFVLKIPTLAVLGTIFSLELLYLVIMASNSRFQRIVRANTEQSEQRNVRVRLEGDLFRMADGAHRNKYIKIRKSIDNIWRNIQQNSSNKDYLRTIKTNLEKLQTQYLKLVFSLNTLDKYIKEAEGGKIEDDIKKLEEEIKSATGSLRELKEQRIEILKKRKDKFGKASQNKEIISNQLDVIEETVKLLIEQAITSSDPDIVSRQIEKVAAEAEVATDSVRELDNFINLTDSFNESDILEISKRIKSL